MSLPSGSYRLKHPQESLEPVVHVGVGRRVVKVVDSYCHHGRLQNQGHGFNSACAEGLPLTVQIGKIGTNPAAGCDGPDAHGQEGFLLVTVPPMALTEVRQEVLPRVTISRWLHAAAMCTHARSLAMGFEAQRVTVSTASEFLGEHTLDLSCCPSPGWQVSQFLQIGGSRRVPDCSFGQGTL